MKSSAPFISSVARDEARQEIRTLRRLVVAQGVLLLIQCAVIVALIWFA